MNRTTYRVSMATMLMFLLLIAALTRIQVVEGSKLRNDPRNFARTQFAEFSRLRGQIATGGKVLAFSDPVDDAYKFQRIYPGKTAKMYAPITGFYSLYNATGIEKSTNSILSGADDKFFGTRIADLFTSRTPRGGNVELTILPAAQTAAWDGLRTGAGAGELTGGIVALRPSTGEILALVSTPSFDPNPLASHESSVVDKSYKKVQEEGSELNRATQETLPPGSVFKVLTTATLLQHGVKSRTKVSSAASTVLPGTSTRLENYGGSTCGVAGQATFRDAFRYSCNVPFVELSARISPQDLKDTAEAFGVGDSYDIGIANNPSTLGSIDDRAALGQTVIGQRDVAFTPLQCVIITAAIANGGKRMEPYLVKAELSHDLKPVFTRQPQEASQAVPLNTARELTDLMLDAEKHAGSHGNGLGLRIASKTGTAEHGEVSSTSVPYTWYTAFAPDYDVAVGVVVISGPGITRNTVGADYAATIGRQVITAVVREDSH